MLKKKTLSKIFKSALIFLTLSVFVVSCDNNSLVQDEPEEGGSELGEEKSITISAPTGVRQWHFVCQQYDFDLFATC